MPLNHSPTAIWALARGKPDSAVVKVSGDGWPTGLTLEI
jgi:hypothetical protein